MKLRFFILSLILSVAILGCKKKDLPDAKKGFYFKALVDGAAVNYEEGKNEYFNGASRITGGSNPGPYNEQQSTILEPINEEINSFGAGFKKIFQGEPQCDERKAMVAEGTFSYSPEISSEGAVVFHTDGDDMIWRSDLGTQTNSTFEVVELKDNSDGYGIMIATIKFSCTLYNYLGESKVVKDGEIRGRIINCL